MGFQSKPIIDFIGQGIAFPIELTNGAATIKTGYPLIRASLESILNWCGGNYKRFYLGEYNSRLIELLEEPNDDITLDLAETFIRDAIDKWEPRVSVISISASRSGTQLQITIIAQIRNTPGTVTFIIPFYTNILA